MDSNSDGVVTIEEFLDTCQKVTSDKPSELHLSCWNNRFIFSVYFLPPGWEHHALHAHVWRCDLSSVGRPRSSTCGRRGRLGGAGTPSVTVFSNKKPCLCEDRAEELWEVLDLLDAWRSLKQTQIVIVFAWQTRRRWRLTPVPRVLLTPFNFTFTRIKLAARWRSSGLWAVFEADHSRLEVWVGCCDGVLSAACSPQNEKKE